MSNNRNHPSDVPHESPLERAARKTRETTAELKDRDRRASTPAEPRCPDCGHSYVGSYACRARPMRDAGDPSYCACENDFHEGITVVPYSASGGIAPDALPMPTNVESVAWAEEADRLANALWDLVHVIEADDLIPESVSYMRQAREVLTRWPDRRETEEAKDRIWKRIQEKIVAQRKGRG